MFSARAQTELKITSLAAPVVTRKKSSGKAAASTSAPSRGPSAIAPAAAKPRGLGAGQGTGCGRKKGGSLVSVISPGGSSKFNYVHPDDASSACTGSSAKRKRGADILAESAAEASSSELLSEALKEARTRLETSVNECTDARRCLDARKGEALGFADAHAANFRKGSDTERR